ncbi:unnamed protein product [Porites evermanni]|uniref:Uncharacterized protein n=1 Tax=Porites evermanni TaxID=104178 RepID=A0ABN8SP45_9CNID|nr:unnamed protein product [Porites evermanni]
MARNRPDRESRRRVEETSGMRNANGKTPGRSSSTSNGGGSNVSRTPPSASSSSASPSGSSATTTPQPLQSTAESINSQSSASTPIVPTRPTNEGGRINRVLAPLLDMNADESVQGGQVPVEILDHLKSFIQKQEEFNQRLEQRIEDNINQSQKGREKKSRRLPKALTANVREVYKSLVGDDRQQILWDFSKSFDGPENRNVNQQILAGVQSTDGVTPVSTIKAAMRVHFRTKRRQHQNSRDDSRAALKQQRVRSRLNTKKNQRVKALNISTSLATEEKERYTKYMTVDYMSSEQSMSESEGENVENGYESPDVERPKKKVFSVSTLPWRSPELTQVMHSLDRKSMRRRSAKATNMLVERRRSGIISSRPAPDDADAYALA